MNKEKSPKSKRKSRFLATLFSVFVILGIATIGYSGFTIMSNYLNETTHASAPMPEEEDFFNEASVATYSGPSRYNIDWEAEFDLIDYEDEDNLSGIVIPSLDMRSETISTSAENGSLVLPDAPLGTWYDKTVPLGSESGQSIIAGHVNYQEGKEFSPWAYLHEAEKGMLIGVRNGEGEIFVYEALEMNVYERQNLPEEYFRKDGEHRLHLVTCSGEVVEDVEELGGRYFEHNLIVSAELVESDM